MVIKESLERTGKSVLYDFYQRLEQMLLEE